jgi:TRAP transporter TAXI family solute receptor
MASRPVLLLLALLLAVQAAAVVAQEPAARYLRIATGPVTGTYFQIGGLIAEVVGAPPGSRPCGRGGSCGVPGLIVAAESSPGSVANIGALSRGDVETAFVQSDVAAWAYEAEGTFAGKPPAGGLRALASLYSESIHLVAAATSGIASIADLRGRRVSLDVEGSGTLVDALLVLGAHGLSEGQIRPVYQVSGASLESLRAGAIDAFFLVAGYPVPIVRELASTTAIRLVPISGPPADRLIVDQPFFAKDEIPAGTYTGTSATPTVSVRALWVASDRLDDETAYGLVASLWHPVSKARLAAGHPRGASIKLDDATEGVAIPFHPGAARLYRERGLTR